MVGRAREASEHSRIFIVLGVRSAKSAYTGPLTRPAGRSAVRCAAALLFDAA